MRSHGSESELVAAMRADPDDVASKLVYADMLLEGGDERGELIRLEHEAATLRFGDGRRRELAQRLDTLRRSCDWGLAHSVDGTDYSVGGGFIREIRPSFDMLERHGLKWFAAQPIRTVVLRLGTHADVARLPHVLAIIPSDVEVDVEIDYRLDPATSEVARHLTTRPHLKLRRIGLDTMLEYFASPHLKSLVVGAADGPISAKHLAAMRRLGSHVTRLWCSLGSEFEPLLEAFLTDASPIDIWTYGHRSHILASVVGRSSRTQSLQKLWLSDPRPEDLAAIAHLPLACLVIDTDDFPIRDPQPYVEVLRRMCTKTFHWSNPITAIVEALPELHFIDAIH